MIKKTLIIGLMLLLTACGVAAWQYSDQPYSAQSCFKVTGEFEFISRDVLKTVDYKFKYLGWIPAENLQPIACTKEGN